MSPNRRTGNHVWVMQEAARYSLPEAECRSRQTIYNKDTKKYESLRKQKRKKLQLVLEKHPDRNDKEWVGDHALSNSSKHIRLWFQNVNGMLKKNDLTEFQYNIAILADSGVNYFAFTESNINANKLGLHSKLIDGFKTVIPNGHFKLRNSPKYLKQSIYQPGGVACGFDASMKMRYLREGMDTFGRWIWQEFGHCTMVTRVYTLYRVNDGSEHASGTSTAWYQQRCLYEEQGKNVNPRKQVIDDLCKELRPWIEKGNNVILGGDFNEHINSKESLSDKMENLVLFNVFEHRLQTKTLPRTHTRGSGAIDHIWTTKHILDNISYSGYTPFGHVWDSDHRGMFIDIKAAILFPTNDISVVCSDFRRLKSTIPKRKKKYLESVQKNWNYHKIDDKYSDLQNIKYSDDPKQFEKTINKLDAQITEILVGAENKCTKVRSHHLDDWAPELMEALEHRLSNLVESIEAFSTASQEYNTANKTYLEMKKNSKQKRTAFQLDLANEKAAQNGTEAAKEIKSLMHIEKQRNQSIRINSVLKPRSGGGPSSILIPSLSEYQRPYPKYFNYREIEFIWQRIEYDNGEDIINWDRITDQKLVESMLLLFQRVTN